VQRITQVLEIRDFRALKTIKGLLELRATANNGPFEREILVEVFCVEVSMQPVGHVCRAGCILERMCTI
jgi:hypothetical protein